MIFVGENSGIPAKSYFYRQIYALIYRVRVMRLCILRYLFQKKAGDFTAYAREHTVGAEGNILDIERRRIYGSLESQSSVKEPCYYPLCLVSRIDADLKLVGARSWSVAECAGGSRSDEGLVFGACT